MGYGVSALQAMYVRGRVDGIYTVRTHHEHMHESKSILQTDTVNTCVFLPAR
jgi:hypothetical protein